MDKRRMNAVLSVLAGTGSRLVRPVQPALPHRHEIGYLDSIRREHEFLFVTGMHRSGTTVAARVLGMIPEISGMSGTPSHMDEGQYLQTVFASDDKMFGMGAFGYHPWAHLRAPSQRGAKRVGVSLLKQWMGYWNLKKPIALEKTPSNLVRVRLLAAVFPKARFIHIVRHPLATAFALRSFGGTNWVKHVSIPFMLKHWARCQRIAFADYASLGERAHINSLEEVVIDPSVMIEPLRRWYGLDVDDTVFSQNLRQGVNAKYAADAAAFLETYKGYPRDCYTIMTRMGYDPRDINAVPSLPQSVQL